MTHRPSIGPCGCSAIAGPLGTCVDYYHAILAEEQTDPHMYRWHAPVVCAYLLQHPSGPNATSLDTQFRLLQFYLDKGIDALLRIAAHQVARNKHGTQSDYDMRPLAPYPSLPAGGPPEQFHATFCELPFTHNSFVSDGYPAYGRRIEAIAAATVESWRSVQT